MKSDEQEFGVSFFLTHSVVPYYSGCCYIEDWRDNEEKR